MSVQTQICDFPGSQGQRLSSRLDLPDSTAPAYAVLAHCFTCGKNGRPPCGSRVLSPPAGLAFCGSTSPGWGRARASFSHATFSGDVADLATAVRAMEREGHPPSLLIGHSLGGAAALAAASEKRGIAAVVTIGAPCDTRHVIRLVDRSLDRILTEGEAQVSLGGESFVIRRAFVEDLRA